MTFVNEIGFERTPRKLGAANADVVFRFPFALPKSLRRSTRVLRVTAPVSVRDWR